MHPYLNLSLPSTPEVRNHLTGPFTQLVNTAPKFQSPASLALQFQVGFGTSDPCSSDWLFRSHWWIPTVVVFVLFFKFYLFIPSFLSFTIILRGKGLKNGAKSQSQVFLRQGTQLSIPSTSSQHGRLVLASMGCILSASP